MIAFCLLKAAWYLHIDRRTELEFKPLVRINTELGLIFWSVFISLFHQIKLIPLSWGNKSEVN